MHSSEDFGVAAGHTGCNASLQRLEVGQDGWRLQHGKKEAQNLQSCADVREVGLVGLLLYKTERST